MILLGVTALASAYCIMLLVAARRMKQRSRSADALATWLLLPIMLVFPPIAIAVVPCLSKIRKYYDEYCDIEAAAQSRA